MRNRLALGIFVTWSVFILFFGAFSPQKAESAKACFVGYSEYGIVNYDRVVSEAQYKSFLDTLASYKINFINIWTMGFSNYDWNGQYGGNCPGFIELMPFKRSGSGGKYNLSDYDPAYFTRLKNFISYAASKGIVVEITLFDSWGLKQTGDFAWSPWDCDYNVNGRICENGCGAMGRFFNVNDAAMMDMEKKYAQKVIYETKNYNNVIYEIMNEPLVCGYENEGKAWHTKVIQWIREAYPNARIVINDDNPIISYVSNYDIISPHYGFWGDGSGNTWIANAINSLNSYGKHVIIDDDGCIWANLRNSPSYQQTWSLNSVNNGGSFTHFQNWLTCESMNVDTGVLNALKTAAQECTSFPFTPSECTDGTLNGQCSSTKPKYCSNGNLINNCSFCGCPTGKTCQTDGICSGGTSGTTFQKAFTCSDGFPSQYCYKEGCMTDYQLFMWSIDSEWGKKEYDLSFSAPQAGKYTCTITATTAHFEHRLESPQYNEKTGVYLNGELVGTTEDPWCPAKPGGGGDGGDRCAGKGKKCCEGEWCAQYGEDVAACHLDPNCCFIYGDEGCGGVLDPCCEGVGDQSYCILHICTWTYQGCKCLKEETTPDKWGQKCEDFTSQGEDYCNVYTNHKGILCCWYDNGCHTDPCPVWYSSRVSGNEGIAEACCTGDAGGCGGYKLRPQGACAWDTVGQTFPCRCGNAPTNPNSYIGGT